MLLEIQLSRREGWYPIMFNTGTFLCQARTWISNIFFFVLSELKIEIIVHFVDIGRSVDNHCLNFLFITHRPNKSTNR